MKDKTHPNHEDRTEVSPDPLAESSVKRVLLLNGAPPKKAPDKPEAWAKSRKPPGGKLSD